MLRDDEPRISVLIADGRKLFREGLAALLSGRAGINVIGEADDSPGALRLARALQPDLILLHLSSGSLPLAVKNVTELSSLARVIVLAASLGADSAKDLLHAGASACLTRHCASNELLEAIHMAMQGRLYLPSDLTDVAIRQLGTHPMGPRSQLSARTGRERPLSDREREILRLIAEGRSTKEIAAVLGVGTKTVETHRRRMMEKLSLWSIAELTRFAISEGLVEVD